jgi:hypothetical protein
MDCFYNKDGVTCCCFTDGLAECRYKAKSLPDVCKCVDECEYLNCPGPATGANCRRIIGETKPRPKYGDSWDIPTFESGATVPEMSPFVLSTKPFRSFDTGATRDLDDDKYDYEAFLSPLVIEAFGAYMHRKRKMADGSLRDGDNWQKGIPLDSYMKSAWRHLHEWWFQHRRGSVDEDALCALLFNVQGYLHEHLKGKRP